MTEMVELTTVVEVLAPRKVVSKSSSKSRTRENNNNCGKKDFLFEDDPNLQEVTVAIEDGRYFGCAYL